MGQDTRPSTFSAPRPLAARAQIHARHLNLHAQPANGVFERHFQVIAKIFAALRAIASAAAPSSTAKQVAKAEQIAENIAEIGEGGRIEALRSHTLQPLVAIAVIGGALLGIAQDAVGLGRFLEPLFGILIVGITIRVVLERQFAVGALQTRVVAVAAHSSRFRSSRAWWRSFLGYRYLHHGRPQQASAKIVPWLILVENGLLFDIAGLHHVDGVVDVGIKLLPLRGNRL